MFHCKRRELTPDELQWLRDNFPTTKNDDIMRHLEISHSHLHKIARELGLGKTKEFVAECQRNAANAAYRLGLRTDFRIQRECIKKQIAAGLTGRRFQKGHNFYDTMSPEQQAEIRKKQGETRKRTFEEDRKRVRWGLEPKTRLRIQERNTPRTNAKYRLMRVLGYVFIEKWLFAYNFKTNRSTLLEGRYAEKFKFKFCHTDDVDNTNQ